MLLNKYARTHESVSKSLVHVTAITLKLFTKHFSIQRQKKKSNLLRWIPALPKTTRSRWTVDLDARHRMLTVRKFIKPGCQIVYFNTNKVKCIYQYIAIFLKMLSSNSNILKDSIPIMQTKMKNFCQRVKQIFFSIDATF